MSGEQKSEVFSTEDNLIFGTWFVGWAMISIGAGIIFGPGGLLIGAGAAFVVTAGLAMIPEDFASRR